MRSLLSALLVAILLSATSPAAAQVALDQARGRPVKRIEIDNPSAVKDEEIRELFLLRPGDPYDPAVVQRSLSLLSQKQAIKNVLVAGTQDGDGLIVRLTVVPEPLIHSIHFTGNRVFRDKDLAAKLRTAVDQPVFQPFLEGDARGIHDAYAEEGYLEARVTPRVEARSDPLWVEVTFQVDEGSAARISRVDPGALGEMEVDRALSIVGLNVGNRASLRKLRKGVKELLDVYHREGYLEARAPKPRFEREGDGVVLNLSLAAGRPVDIEFEGKSGASLLNVVKEHYGESVDADWTDNVAAAMSDALRAEGYRQAIVTAELKDQSDRRKVTFHVERGPLVRVGNVIFEGNKSEPASRLKSYMSLVEGGFIRSPPFTQEALDRDVRVLGAYYVSQGFVGARVSVLDLAVESSGSATLKLRVEEGIRFKIGHLDFQCDSGLTPAEALKVSELKSADYVNPAALEEARVRLLAEIAKKGFTDGSVELSTKYLPESKTVDVTFLVRAASLVRFGKIVVSGNARTQTPVIQRELTFKEGDVWNAQQVLLSKQQLFRLGFFRRVRIEPLDPTSTAPVRDVRIAVEEQDAGSVSFDVGYGTEEGLSVSGEVGHANLFGSGRAVRLRAGVTGQDWSSSASFKEPWFLGYRLDLVLSLLRQYENRPGYDILTTGFQASLDKKVTEKIRASILYTLEDNKLSHVAETADLKGINQYLLSAIGPVVAWDSRNDPFNPTEGFQHTIQAEWALDALGSEVQYGRYVGTSSGFFSRGKVTLALLARAGFALNLGKTADLPANKRFYLGGRNTVRGFDRDELGPKDASGDPLGGDTMLNFRSELRFPIWKGVGGDVFWDAGNVWNRNIESPDYLDLRHGVGGGLRYVTPIGPISLDIGFKLGRKEGESPSVWYFTIGNVF